MFKRRLNSRSRPFKPHDIALAVFLAGCVPTILMAVIAYSILRSTLESRMIVDRHTLVQSIARLISAETVRTAEVIEYYQTSRSAQEATLARPGDPEVQGWLADVYYSHPRIDGMFVTDSAGKLIAAVPANTEDLGRDFASDYWLENTRAATGAHVSSIHPRVPDRRHCSVIAAAVRTTGSQITGFIGATVLVERIGKRLAALHFGDESRVGVLDQHGVPLFDEALEPNTATRAADIKLLQAIRGSEKSHLQLGSDLVTFSRIDGTEWLAVLRQPAAVAYRPIHDLVRRTALIAGWLILLSALAAWFMSKSYKNQLAANERIAREKLFNETILANMPIGIALVDPADRSFLQANEAFVGMMKNFGRAPDGVSAAGSSSGGSSSGGTSTSELRRLVFGEVWREMEDAFEKVAETGEPFEAHEQAVKARDGSEHFLTINILRLRDPSDRIHGILLLARDNTSEITLRKELIAANTAKDQFLAVLSHELRNPLSPVITMVHELEKTAGDNSELRGPLEIIRRNVELEARLIDDLLDLTRITHGKLQLTPEIINAHRAVHRALEICQRDIDAKKIETIVELEAGEHHVKADPARFQQVLWNLIKNAVKFTSEHGRITIRSRNMAGRRLRIDVSDTGIGVEPHRLAKIFNAFEQGESSITRRFGGLGLGLTISKAMIEAHGGQLTASSKGRGQGSTFSIEINTVDASTTSDEGSKTPTLAGATLQHRILLVDDHEDTCLGMKLLLERRGYRVKIANSVGSALDLAGKEKFELLISDLGLPDGTGFELMEKLRSTNGIKGVALSGFGMESDIERSRQAGFSDHLIKPVNLERLDAILKRLFGDGGGRPA